MQHYSTEDYLGHSKIERWQSIAETVFTKLNVKAHDPKAFQGEVDSARFGPVTLAFVNASPATVTRSSDQAEWSRDRSYFLHLQVKGKMFVFQDGRESLINEGDLSLCDSGMAYKLEYDEPAQTLVMMVPHNVVKRKLPAPEVALGRRMDGGSGLGAMLAGSLTQMWNLAQADDIDENIAARLGENVIDLFSIATLGEFGNDVLASATGSARRSHIRCYIESNLKDPDMTVTSIAKSFRISTRYLHMLFAEGKETVSELIRRRRLEEIRKRLGNPNWKNRTITQLAFAWGFNNTTHFARVFRERFGQSPREYRKAMLSQAEKAIDKKDDEAKALKEAG